MANTNAFELAYQALMSQSIHEKVKLTQKLSRLKDSHQLDYDKHIPIHDIKDPGRPNKPTLVRFGAVPKRDQSDMGMIKTIHAICHIEFNAINLALDAVYRFQHMEANFHKDWIQVAYEESQHFEMIRQYLKELGYQYGDFDAHNGLWTMTHETNYDVLSRMALVPRVLEARGLDVTPSIQKKFKKSKFKKMVKILDVIYHDEIGHVRIGNHWFHALCQDRGLDAIKTFDGLIKKHIGNELRGVFNIEARKLTGFTKQEIDYLQNL